MRVFHTHNHRTTAGTACAFRVKVFSVADWPVSLSGPSEAHTLVVRGITGGLVIHREFHWIALDLVGFHLHPLESVGFR